MKKRNVVLSLSDKEILSILYGFEFVYDYQIALITGMSREYIKGRVKQLAQAGLTKRTILRAECPAANWITVQGMKEAGLPIRSSREPKLSRVEHGCGVVDSCIYLSLLRKRKDGSVGRITEFGQIISERDFNAVREMKRVGTKINGRPIYIGMDSQIHHPDAYFERNGAFCSIEFERTPKSKLKILRDNVYANTRRFKKQYWFFDKPSVGKALLDIQQELGTDQIQVIDIRKVREVLERRMDQIPKTIPAKSGKPRVSNFGTMAEPVPLNKLPIIRSAAPVLETRSENGSTLDTEQPMNGPDPVLNKSKMKSSGKTDVSRPDFGPVASSSEPGSAPLPRRKFILEKRGD